MPWQKAADLPERERMIVGVWGEQKSGKTQFALTFPDPIFYFNFDWGMEHHLPGLRSREVFVADYLTVNPQLTESEAESMLAGFERDYGAALKVGNGTLVIDTGTALWNLASKVFLDDIKKKRRDGQIYPFDYANANAYFQNLINQVKQTGMNLCLVQRAREKYNNQGQATGVYEAQGNNAVPYLVQVQLHLFKQADETGVVGHFGKIESCWQTSLAEGAVLENPTYASLTDLITALAGAGHAAA